jgi:hypothetical protein
MSIETASPESHGYDFSSIEAAVKETERGRWFLAEYDRRNRSADTHALLEAIGKFERIARAVPLEPHAVQSRPELSEAIRIAKTEIEELHDATPALALPRGNAFAGLSVHANAVAAELSQLSEVMQETLDSMKGNPEGIAGAMAHVLQRLIDVASLNGALAHRTARAARLLVHLDRELNGEGDGSTGIAAQLEKLAAGAPRPPRMLSEENLKYFGKDQELFTDQNLVASATSAVGAVLPEPPATPVDTPQPAADAAANARIVIVRTPASATQPIPLVNDVFDQPQTAA